MQGQGALSLRGEPDRLRRERAAIEAAISALSLSHYTVHIANYHCAADVRTHMTAAVAALPALGGVASALAAEADAVESDLASLRVEHARLRRTLTQQHPLLELLEAPSIMESAMRGGLWDEALDVTDYATNLFFTHKLYMSTATESVATINGAVPDVPAATAADIVRGIVDEVRALAREGREALLAQLAGRITLPGALKLLGHLRRLYTQQALARKRVAALSSSSSSSSSAAPLSESAFALGADEDAAIVGRLRLEFLSARDTWHCGELEALPRHNAHQYLMRLIEAQRGGWADIAAQFVAVCNTVRPAVDRRSPSPSAAAAATALAVDQASARALMASWLSGRISWFVRTLGAGIGAVDDGAQLAALLVQATYAARRAGRLGSDYSALLPPLFEARVRGLFSARLAATVAQFRDDVSGWAWAYKVAHSQLPQTASTAHSAMPLPDDGSPAPAATPNAVAAPPLAPPLSLLAFHPLGEFVNGYLLCFNTARPAMPVDAGGWVRAETFAALAAAAASLRAATASPASPLLALAAAARRPGGAATQVVDGEAVGALRRFAGLVSALADEGAGYVLLVAAHLTGGSALDRTGNDNPGAAAAGAAAVIAHVSAAGTKNARTPLVDPPSLGDPALDEAWARLRFDARDALQSLGDAAARVGVKL